MKFTSFKSPAIQGLFVLFCAWLFLVGWNAWSNPKVEVTRETMIAGLMAQRGHMRHVDKSYATKLVDEAIAVTSETEYAWLSPQLLLGLAINESDLREGLQRGYDCGITQNRVTLFAKTRKTRKQLCDRIADSSKTSFEYAAKELTNIRDRYCSVYLKRRKEYAKKCAMNPVFCAKHDRFERRFLRCLLNNYNQGPRYYKEEKCRGRRRCRVRARYWKRVLCFATGVRLGRSARWACRRAWSVAWISRAFKVTKDKVVLN
jgi:hypothetical protein